MTEPVIEPDPVEKEDGELSDDCTEEPTPVDESVIERLAAGANLLLATSNSSEGEIDRVIAKIEAANGQLAAVETTPSTPTVRSMLDPPPPNVDELVEATSNVNLDETSLSELRAAALKSMKRKEDGEISENSPSEAAVNEVPRRRKISDRLQIVLSPEVARKKKSPSPVRRPARLENDKRGSKRRRSTRRERSPLVESYQQGKHGRGRSRSRTRSRSRDRRRPSSHKKAKRDREPPKKPAVVTESSSTGSINWRRIGEEEHGSSRPRGHRSTAEHMSIVLGGPAPPVSSSPIYSPLPPPPPAPQLLQENDIHCEDNFEVVAMDIDTSSAECSRPPTRNAPPTRNRVGSDTDERILRNLLLTQLQKKGGGNTPNMQQENTPAQENEDYDVERCNSVEVIPSTPSTSFVPLGHIAVKTECRSNAEEEEQYLANKEKLRRLNRLITTREHQIEVLDEEKEKLMRKLDEVMSRMTEFQHEYWSAVTERDALRPVVEEYQQKKIRGFSDADSIRSFTDRLNQRSRQLVAVSSAPPSSQRRPSPSSLDTSDVASQQQEQQQSVPVVEEEQPPPASPDQSMDVDEVPPPASPDREEGVEEDEEEDAALIEMARKVSSSIENGEESSEEREMRLRAVLLEKYRIKRQQGEHSPPMVIPVSPQPTREEPATPQKNSAPVQEVVQREETATSTSGGEEATSSASQVPVDDSTRLNAINQRREHVRRVYQNHSLPRRLLPHAGVPLPKDVDRQICQYELSGKCKDVTCEYHHYNDDKLSLREIMSMILSFAPELSGDYQYEGMKKRLDAVISWKEPQEEKADFVRRMLRRLPQTRNDVDARMAQVNDETGDFENYYTSLNIAQG